MSTMADTPKRRPRRKFTDEFKEQAARLVLDGGKSDQRSESRRSPGENLPSHDIDGRPTPRTRLR